MFVKISQMFEQFAKILVADDEITSLKDITQNPRKASTQEIINAVNNLYFDFTQQNFEAIIKYICCDFFLFCHQSGLYNRQFKLWKSISQVSTAHFRQLKLGIFANKPIPIYDFLLKNSDNKSLIFASYILGEASSLFDSPKGANQFLINFVNRLEKICAQENTICGSFFLIPDENLAYYDSVLQKFISISNPISLYESLLPEPLNIPLNIVSINSHNEFKLLVPNIKKQQLI